MKRHPDTTFQMKVDLTRTEAMRVLSEVRRGYVNSKDIDALTKFVTRSLALMQMEGPRKWAMTKFNADLTSLNRGDYENRAD